MPGRYGGGLPHPGYRRSGKDAIYIARGVQGRRPSSVRGACDGSRVDDCESERQSLNRSNCARQIARCAVEVLDHVSTVLHAKLARAVMSWETPTAPFILRARLS